MNAYWWLMAVALLVVVHYANKWGPRLVEWRTGRTNAAERPILYDLTFFGVALPIGLLPIALLPDSDPLVYCGILFFGLTLGQLVAQTLFGQRAEKRGE